MRKKIFASICLAVIITLLLTTAFVTNIFYTDSIKELKKEISNEANYVAKAIELIDEESTEYLEKIGKESYNRITLIDKDGTVLFDNVGNIDEMENHLERPEVIEAMENGEGFAERRSTTLDKNSIYFAVSLDDETVLRVGTNITNSIGLMRDTIIWIIYMAVLVLIIAVLIAHFLTKAIIRPINEIDLDNPTSKDNYEEISPLLRKMERQNKEIESQIKLIEEKQMEFKYITDNMSEGIVILGERGKVLSANTSAVKILGNMSDSYIGLCRDINYLKAVENALKGNQTTVKIEKDSKIFRITASPVSASSFLKQNDSQTETKDFGTVVFIVDITDSEFSEKMRREFSANVSHELKTPLTSIMGYAEIIANGIAKAEDIPNFADNIRSEAERLLMLIEDIIKLSRLDEETLFQEFENVELSGLVNNVKNNLYNKTQKLGISFNCFCEKTFIKGIAPILEEMIFNLCDNAINYNKANGSIEVLLKNNPEPGVRAILTVKDTGVGIEKEHQQRVFERFYRVDKSHSKETGGTGLGLSIVKHAAALHGAKIELDSKFGEGTEIKIIF